MTKDEPTGPGRYGKYYWGLHAPDRPLRYFHADKVEVTESGALLFHGKTGVNVAFSAGNWTEVFAASQLDGHAIAEEADKTPEPVPKGWRSIGTGPGRLVVPESLTVAEWEKALESARDESGNVDTAKMDEEIRRILATRDN